MKHLTLFIALICASATHAAEPARFLAATPDSVCFIGNSFTGGEFGLYARVPELALAATDPDTIVCGAHIDGGKDLKYHWNLGLAQQKIRSAGWDAVVIQEFNPLVPGSAGLDTFFHYAALFDALIDSIGAQTVFYMTHDNQLHDITNIAAANDSAGILFNAVVVPCGLTHEIVKAEHPYLNPLFDPFDTDGVHPGSVGRYLNICTFYTAFTRKSPVGITYNPGVYPTYSSADLLYLQSASWDLMRAYIETPCTDANAPTVPGNLAGYGRSLSSAGLTWDDAVHAACGVRKYNVYRDSIYAGSAYQPVFVDTNLLGGTAYEYTVSAVSLGGVESAPSAPLPVTTIADTILPELVEVPVTKRATQVELIFSEALDPASAGTPGNYTVDNGVTVSAAVLKGGTRVSLTVTPLSEDVTYTVTVTGVRDASTSMNAIAAGTRGTFTYVAPAMMEHCVGYYPFEMSLEDYSPTGLTATWKRDPSFTAAGYDGYGVECIGTDMNSYPVIPRHASNRNMDAFTCALWIRKAVASEDGWIFHQQTGFDVRVQAASITGNVITDSVSASFTLAVPQVNNTEWHHFALTYDGAMVRLYLDALEIGSDTCIGTRTAYAGISVGNHTYVAGTSRSFFGQLDELRLYDTGLDSLSIAALFADNAGIVARADSLAVQEIIQQNMLITSVNVVATRNAATGRVLACNFDSMGTYRIISEVGQLTALRALYCAGDSTADSLLTIIDPALGTCTALETLIIRDNQLTELPDEITNLTGLVLLDVSGNLLCDVSDPVKTWLDTYDPDWADSQRGCIVNAVRVPAAGIILPVADGTLFDAMGRTVDTGLAPSGIYLKYDAENRRMEKILIVK